MNPFDKSDFAAAARLTWAGRMKGAMDMLKRARAADAPTSDRYRAAPSSPRSGLSEILGRLGLRDSSSNRSRPTVEDAEFLDCVFTGSAGTRPYKLYVPSSYVGTPMPLIVMLHGCGQSPDDFATGTRMNQLAESEGFLVAYPGQTHAANAAKCWNWFAEDHQHRDRGEPSLIAGITLRIMSDWSIDPERVFIAGLSAGGALAAVMGAEYPDLFAAVGVHSGLACGVARDMPTGLAAMRKAVGSVPADRGRNMPTIVFHGDKDSTVVAANGDQVIAQAGAGLALQTRVMEGQSFAGLRYTRRVHSSAQGQGYLEQWVLHGAGHAWSGGDPVGSFTEPRGPDASTAMVQFFLHAR